jgi:peptide/nickel transport system substrate-binding protein
MHVIGPDNFEFAPPHGRLSRRRLLAGGIRLGLAAPLAAGLVSLSGSAGASPRPGFDPRSARRGKGDGETFTALIAYGAEDIDPHSAYGALGPLVSLGIYESLVRYSGSNADQYEPDLAESWEISEDGTTYTFRLFPNVLFHDGTPCDAQAVKDSFARVLGLGLGPVYVVRRFIGDLAQIDVVDPLTIRFNLGTPQPLFLAALASGWGPYVVSPTAVAEHRTDEDPWAHEWFLSNAVGTGPYTLIENSYGERIVLSKFDDFHGGWDGGHFDQVVIRVVPESATRRQLIERGEADATTFNLTPEDVESLHGNADLQVVTYDSTRVSWTIMNPTKLRTREVRQGFSYAFPYEEVLNGVYRGLLTRSGPIPTTVRGYDPNVFLYQTDLVKAKDLIRSGGFQEGDSFDYVVDSTNAPELIVAQLFQANLQAIGFDLRITTLDGAAVEAIVFGGVPVEEVPDFIAWAWWPDYNDPWSHLSPNFLATGIGNPGRWSNDRFEQIMAEAEHYGDETHLAELMIEAQNLLTEQDPPVIYYGQLQYYTVLGKTVQGYYPNPFYLESYPFYQMSRAE